MNEIDYAILRQKLKEERYDELTEEEQAVLNKGFSELLEAITPILEEIKIVYTELFNIIIEFLS